MPDICVKYRPTLSLAGGEHALPGVKHSQQNTRPSIWHNARSISLRYWIRGILDDAVLHQPTRGIHNQLQYHAMKLLTNLQICTCTHGHFMVSVG